MTIAIASLIVGDCAGASAAPAAFDGDAALERIRKANILSPPPGALASYRADVCLIVRRDAAPRAGGAKCLKGGVGFASPASAYLSVDLGASRLVQLVNGDAGWQIVAPVGAGATAQPPVTTKLGASQLNALRENARHSLLSVFRLLAEGDSARLKVSGAGSHVVATWHDGLSSNEYFFSRQSWLCEKQVRRTPQGVTVLRYDDYRKVSGLMLPHRIETAAESGEVIGTQLVDEWRLAVPWQSDFFSPEGIVKNL